MPTERPSIRVVGEVLFGRSWQSDLARGMGKAINTVQRWADGSRNPRDENWRQILALMRARRSALDLVIAQLEAAENEHGAMESSADADHRGLNRRE